MTVVTAFVLIETIMDHEGISNLASDMLPGVRITPLIETLAIGICFDITDVFFFFF